MTKKIGNEIENCLKEIEELTSFKIEYIKPVDGGLTNTNHLVLFNGEKYVVRMPGAGANEMIDRTIEKKNNQLGCSIGVNPKCLYFSENSGIKIVKYVEYSEKMVNPLDSQKDVVADIYRLLREFHDSNQVMENDFNIIDCLLDYEKLNDELHGEYPEDYKQIREKVLTIYNDIDKNIGFNKIACHNDALIANFIHSSDGKIYLVDWEYAGNNDSCWDVTSMMIESEFDREFVECAIAAYYGNNVNEDDIIKIKFFTIFQDFLWSVWSMVKIANGVDYKDYLDYRYNRCRRNINLFINQPNIELYKFFEEI